MDYMPLKRFDLIMDGIADMLNSQHNFVCLYSKVSLAIFNEANFQVCVYGIAALYC